MSRSTQFTQFGLEGILQNVDEKLVPCPNPQCDGTIDAQKIIACYPRPGTEGRYLTTDCCGLDRDELFELVEPDDSSSEPMEDAYPVKVDA